MAFLFFGKQFKKRYEIIARLTVADFCNRYEVEASSPYEACRRFDTESQYSDLTRISGATLVE